MRSHSVKLRCTLLTLLPVIGAATIACSGSLPSASANMATGEALNDLATVISQLREENARLQAQIDSLGSVVAYQDSVVRQLAVTAGVSMRPQGVPSP